MPETDWDPDRKLIWIPAVPSSGTSCLAGILHQLGVNMGKMNTPVWLIARGYPMYEDAEYYKFQTSFVGESGEPKEILDRHFRMRPYCNYRFMQDEGRVGAKGPAHWWMDDSEPETLPIEIVDIYRPLEDSILADFKRNQHRVERNPTPEMKKKGPPSDREIVVRAAGIAGCFVAREMLMEKIEPKIRISFYDLLENPEPHVQKLIECLDLGATDDQYKAALSSINPKMRNV